jgi:hypothetical protein
MTTIAQRKRKQNIAEYLLYMWQIEDLLRAYNFDLHTIENEFLKASDEGKANIEEETNWLANIITSMKNEGIEEKGHLSSVMNDLASLTHVHEKLLATKTETEYHEYYKMAEPNINTLKTKVPDTTNEIEIALQALYGIVLLKLQNKEISQETQIGVTAISNLLALLSKKYREYESSYNSVKQN